VLKPYRSGQGCFQPGPLIVHDLTPDLTAMNAMIDPDFFRRDVTDVARALLGARLLVDGVGGIIVETEAYHHEDPASHSFSGRTPRNASMFGPPGQAYVYLSYGIHWCFNIVCGVAPGSAVLVRALQPTDGLDLMTARRGTSDPRKLCAGPGRLCQALALTRANDGQALDGPPFSLEKADPVPEIVSGPRIGIKHGADRLWRFGIAGSCYLSRRF
jgi:DNA-3-methyladenine glycosylase